MNRLLLYSLILDRMVYGSVSETVALLISRTVRSAPRSHGAEGLAEGWVRSFYSDGSGSLWVAAEGGLSRIKDGRVLTLTSQNGLPCNTVQWMMEDDADSVWLYTACGLVRVARSELDAWVSHPTQTIRRRCLTRSDGSQPAIGFTGGFRRECGKIRGRQVWFLLLAALAFSILII
jgi:ligand-binding sensor domain-containing protein